jgi:hypothetical protein
MQPAWLAVAVAVAVAVAGAGASPTRSAPLTTTGAVATPAPREQLVKTERLIGTCAVLHGRNVPGFAVRTLGVGEVISSKYVARVVTHHCGPEICVRFRPCLARDNDCLVVSEWS